MTKWGKGILIVVTGLLAMTGLVFFDHANQLGLLTSPSKLTSIGNLQSVYQLGAAVSLTFAFAGPKLADLLSGKSEEVRQSQIALAALLRRANEPLMSKRERLLSDTIQWLSAYESRNSLRAPYRAKLYFAYACLCFFLLLTLCFSTVRLPNGGLLSTCMIALVPSVIDLWITTRAADAANDVAEALRKLAMTDPQNSGSLRRLGVVAISLLQRLEDKTKVKRRHSE